MLSSIMNPAYISALSTLCASAIGAFASVATALTILFLPALYALCFRRSLNAGGATVSQEASQSDERPPADTAAHALASGAARPRRPDLELAEQQL
jgi:hypothetical protein